MKQACLYDRLGGASAIDAAAELFCRKVLADPALAGLPRLNDWHFDRVIGHLGTTLRELGAAEPDIAAAGAIAESTRDHVLNR